VLPCESVLVLLGVSTLGFVSVSFCLALLSDGGFAVLRCCGLACSVPAGCASGPLECRCSVCVLSPVFVARLCLVCWSCCAAPVVVRVCVGLIVSCGCCESRMAGLLGLFGGARPFCACDFGGFVSWCVCSVCVFGVPALGSGRCGRSGWC